MKTSGFLGRNPIKKMPVLFIGHGSPINAVEKNKFSDAWRALAGEIPKPEAILCISAHWLKEGTAVTAMENPKTIHDFYGFPEQLNKAKYPAKGSKEIAGLVKDVVKIVRVDFDYEWGLDHGAWSVLKNMYPKADIPVLQLSLDYQLSLDKAFQVGKELSQLRNKGILIIGSGNIVHNLMLMRQDAKPYEWAVAFGRFVKSNLEKKRYGTLMDYTKNKCSALAHPTDDHYLPLIYAVGAAIGEKPQFLTEEIFYASVSMMSLVFGINKKL